MIAACPKCGARYRIDKERLPAEGARLRCSRCEAVFRVSPPAREEPAPEVVQAPVEPSKVPPPPPSPPPAETRDRLVLIADSEIDAGKATAQALAGWGLETVLVHDGVDAILTIQRMLPRAVVLDAALPKMFGFQVCELMKRNESLRGIHVVLIGAIHDRERYRRPPTEFYGADAYVERPNLPDALQPILAGFGVPIQPGAAPAPAPPAPAPEPPVARVGPTSERPSQLPPPPPPMAQEPAPVAPQATESAISAQSPEAPEVPQTPEPRLAPPASEPQVVAPPRVEPSLPTAPPPPADVGNEPTVEIPRPTLPAAEPVAAPAPAPAEASSADPEVQKAERLARIVVSDIVLYNEEKFSLAVQAGNVLEAMEGDMQEGRALFVQRIDSRVRESRDFLADELLRVARQRGMP